MARLTKSQLEHQDLGRVLAAVFHRTDLSPVEAVDRFLEPDLKHIASSVSPFLQFQIDDLRPLRVYPGAEVHVGGGGVVLHVHTEIEDVEHALKIPRPSLFEQRKAAENYIKARLEPVQHAPISHRNVAQVFGVGKLDMKIGSVVEWRVFPILMEWIPKPVPLTKYLASESVQRPQEVLSILTQVVDGLAAIHARNLIHWDIKADNILVDAGGTPKVTDLGSSRRTVGDRDSKAFSTLWNLPPKLREDCKVDPRRFRGSSRRVELLLPSLEWDCAWLDLWMLGRELNRLLLADNAILADDRTAGFPREQRPDAVGFLRRVLHQADEQALLTLNALRLVVGRLLYPQSPSTPSCYPDCRSLKKALERIRAATLATVPELLTTPQHVLRLPVSGNAPWSKRVARLYDAAPVKRLARHSQLGSVAHVYPGGTHRRSEHVAGVYAVAGAFLRALDADNENPFWRLDVTAGDAETVLIAALCHDVGHMAFGHYLEEMDAVFTGRTHEDYIVACMDTSRASPELTRSPRWWAAILADREAISTAIGELWQADSSRGPEVAMKEAAGLLARDDPTTYAAERHAVLDPKASHALKTDVLRTILSSAMDADKIDYLLRDAHHCGVRYANGFDADRFFQALTPLHYIPEGAPDRKACVGLDSKGVLPAESLFIARYQLFACVYWHHAVRAETTMLQMVVQHYLMGEGERNVEERLDILAEVFRESDDNDALMWLGKQIRKATTQCDVERSLLLRSCACLLGQPKLRYRRAFEIGVTREARNVYENLQQTFEGISRSSSPGQYIQHYREFRDRVTVAVATRLKKPIKPGELLVDIPPAGKDQIENVFVRKGPDVKAIQSLSPVAAAVADAFAFYARPLRVFLAPSAGERLRGAGLSDKAIRQSIWRVLRGQEVLFADDDDG